MKMSILMRSWPGVDRNAFSLGDQQPGGAADFVAGILIDDRVDRSADQVATGK